MTENIEQPSSNIYQNIDPRNVGIYTAADAARYLRVPYTTVRSWVFGSKYHTKIGSKRFEPVIKIPDTKTKLMSFTNLVELHTLNAFRRVHQLTLDKVRQGIEYLQHTYKMEHPLAYQKLYTDGADLFIEQFGKFVNASQCGQLVMKEIIQIYLKRIEWDNQCLPAKLYPFTRPQESELPRLIVIDPFVSFGQPVLSGTGIPTKIIAERYSSGESINHLAHDYNCETLLVEEAIRYELASVA
ncbi:MAG: DUF433 domain-containing protein [Scytonema sp. PMC 1069.18]|nr:DUF433 domain-containing protein [Scytonema sp. PMC 1069.18]MEC4885958.1 DUF433 domain-containing protein [Scytonema sp. PMC 1070.18]